MAPPDIQEALAALDAELGEVAVVRLATPGEPRRRRKPDVNWQKVRDWCIEHEGVAFTADGVHANVGYRLRKRFPELRVEGFNHRHEEGTGRRIATVKVVYEGAPVPEPPPPDGPTTVAGDPDRRFRNNKGWQPPKGVEPELIEPGSLGVDA